MIVTLTRITRNMLRAPNKAGKRWGCNIQGSVVIITAGVRREDGKMVRVRQKERRANIPEPDCIVVNMKRG